MDAFENRAIEAHSLFQAVPATEPIATFHVYTSSVHVPVQGKKGRSPSGGA